MTYKQVMGWVSSTEQHNFPVSKNASKGPLSIEEQKALSALVKRHAVDYQGKTCLRVPTGGRPRTFMFLIKPNKPKVG